MSFRFVYKSPLETLPYISKELETESPSPNEVWDINGDAEPAEDDKWFLVSDVCTGSPRHEDRFRVDGEKYDVVGTLWDDQGRNPFDRGARIYLAKGRDGEEVLLKSSQVDDRLRAQCDSTITHRPASHDLCTPMKTDFVSSIPGTASGTEESEPRLERVRRRMIVEPCPRLFPQFKNQRELIGVSHDILLGMGTLTRSGWIHGNIDTACIYIIDGRGVLGEIDRDQHLRSRPKREDDKGWDKKKNCTDMSPFRDRKGKDPEASSTGIQAMPVD